MVKFHCQVLNRAPENLVTNLVRLAWCLSLISDSGCAIFRAWELMTPKILFGPVLSVYLSPSWRIYLKAMPKFWESYDISRCEIFGNGFQRCWVFVGEWGHFAGPHGEAAFLADSHQRGHELRFIIKLMAVRAGDIRYPLRIMDEYGIYILCIHVYRYICNII